MSQRYSNGLDPQRVLCRYDLGGQCNNKKCPGQHARDYLLTDLDMCKEILAYSPAFARGARGL
jgi:hypothetical protein